MLVTCGSILNLPYLEKMKVVAGKGGLDKIITWVHVVEMSEVAKWVKGGELLFITGVTIKDNVQALVKLVKDISKRNLSGLVINVGPYIKKTPEEVKELADTLNFPIFEIPFEVKLIEVTHIICKEIFNGKIYLESVNNFMKELIYGDVEITEEIITRAGLYGYSRKKTYFSLVVDIDNFSSYIKKNKIKDEKIILDIKMHIEHIIEYVMYKYNRKYLYMVNSDSFYLIVPLDNENKNLDIIEKISQNIKDNIEKEIDNIKVSIGIGGISSELKEFKSIMFQAQKALEVSKKCEMKSSIVDYKKLGVYRLFFDMRKYDEMKNIYNENLENLKKYDKKNSTSMLKTLEFYINEQRNLGRAAVKLYIHRNTMRYRIKRIEEILQCDLNDEKVIFNITLSIKIGKFLKLI